MYEYHPVPPLGTIPTTTTSSLDKYYSMQNIHQSFRPMASHHTTDSSSIHSVCFWYHMQQYSSIAYINMTPTVVVPPLPFPLRMNKWMPSARVRPAPKQIYICHKNVEWVCQRIKWWNELPIFFPYSSPSLYYSTTNTCTSTFVRSLRWYIHTYIYTYNIGL